MDVLKEMVEIGQEEKRKEDKQAFPTLSEMSKNILSDGIKWIKSGLELAQEDIVAERLSICENCEFYVDKRCSKCGCFMKVKVNVATSVCPIGKWEAVSEKSESTQTE